MSRPPHPLELAQAAYEAYGDWTGWRNYQGLPMPAWGDLGQDIQYAWAAAAGAVEHALLTPGWAPAAARPDTER